MNKQQGKGERKGTKENEREEEEVPTEDGWWQSRTRWCVAGRSDECWWSSVVVVRKTKATIKGRGGVINGKGDRRRNRGERRVTDGGVQVEGWSRRRLLMVVDAGGEGAARRRGRRLVSREGGGIRRVWDLSFT